MTVVPGMHGGMGIDDDSMDGRWNGRRKGTRWPIHVVFYHWLLVELGNTFS